MTDREWTRIKIEFHHRGTEYTESRGVVLICLRELCACVAKIFGFSYRD
jgi:hypothetical protein